MGRPNWPAIRFWQGCRWIRIAWLRLADCTAPSLSPTAEDFVPKSINRNEILCLVSVTAPGCRLVPSNGAAEPRHSISSASCAAQQHGLLSAAVVFCSSVTPSARASSPSPRPEWVWSLHGEARILDAVVPWTRGWAASWTTARCVGAAGGAGVFEPRAGAAA